MNIKTFLVIFGTRPEAIKLAPLIFQLKKEPDIKVKICVSYQHVELLNQVLNFFEIDVDYNLNIMTENQSLSNIMSKCLTQFEKIIDKEKPQLIIVQGDTSTALSGALSGYYSKVPVAHIEAGLRTYDNYNPFPEEVNRKMIAQVATFHFAPNTVNKQNLNDEGVNKNIWVVGNTGIDALFLAKKYISNGFSPSISLNKKDHEKLILVTGHRRENIGEPFSLLCDQLTLVAKQPGIKIVFPLHLNPNLKNVAVEKLSNKDNIVLLDPQPYPDFVWMMQNVDLIITDSGGIQEEAPYLEVPVLVTRKTTERMETLNGKSKLIDLSKRSLVDAVNDMLRMQKSNSVKVNYPYGKGNSSDNIVSIVKRELALL